MRSSAPDSPGLLKTKEVLEGTGITHQILYRYVTMGLVEEIEPAPGKRHRRFPAETIAVIKLIQSLNQSGYTLRDIKDIFFKEERLKSVRRRWAQRRLKTRSAARGKKGKKTASRRTKTPARRRPVRHRAGGRS